MKKTFARSVLFYPKHLYRKMSKTFSLFDITVAFGNAKLLGNCGPEQLGTTAECACFEQPDQRLLALEFEVVSAYPQVNEGIAIGTGMVGARFCFCCANQVIHVFEESCDPLL